MWDLNVSVPDHCLSFYFSLKFSFINKVRYYFVLSEINNFKSLHSYMLLVL